MSTPSTDFLDLPGLRVLAVASDVHNYHVTASAAGPPTRCAHCEDAGAGLYSHGWTRQVLIDLPVRAKRVGIILQRQRYRCLACGRTFLEVLEGVDERRAMTARLRRWIELQALQRPFTQIADEVGISEGTVRQVFTAYYAQRDRDREVVTPRWLGIDEIHVGGQFRCVLTDVERQRVVELLENRSRATLASYLATLSEHGTIEVVAADMYPTYRNVVREVLPAATLVADRFHVVRLASRAVERVRRGVLATLSSKQRASLGKSRRLVRRRAASLTEEQKEQLASWRSVAPTLARAYELKEAFYALWDAPDRTSAERELRAWRAGVPENLQPAFHDLLAATRGWEAEILAFFDCRVTNGYTEGLNAAIRVLDRMGRGYGFKALRAKVLYSRDASRVGTPFKDSLAHYVPPARARRSYSRVRPPASGRTPPGAAPGRGDAPAA